MEKKKQTVRNKILSVLENIVGAQQFIRAHAAMAMHVDNWEVELMPLRLELAAFVESREKDVNNLNHVIQFGSLWLTTEESFLRGEFVKENVKLTQEERENLKEELADAFHDPKLKDRMMTKAAAIGWVIYDIMTPYIDSAMVEEIIQRKIAGIRLNLMSKFASDQIEKVSKDMQKGLMVADRLEHMGLVLNADETVECESDNLQEYWNKISAPDYVSPDASVMDTPEAIEEELKDLKTPIAKMLLEANFIEKL